MCPVNWANVPAQKEPKSAAALLLNKLQIVIKRDFMIAICVLRRW